jgi:DNA-binding NtrC family response regulator
VRVIAATNRDLKKNVEEGQFREDLYYRLKVVEVKLPPLRERREDIPLLVDHFIKRFNEKFGRDISGISTEVQGLFMEYGWPGNIRELEHAIEHAFVLCRHPVITLSDVPQELKDFTGAPVSTPAKEREDPSQAIIDALKKAGWNKVKAAQLLGMSRSTLYRKIEEYGIKGEDFSL